jgi:glycosyltransferase involved in cell wall biosynthesis
MDLAVVVPFHNEERHLPALIRALRSQTAVDDVPVIFVDNASTDGSADIVRETEEFLFGKWTCLEEPTIGKLHAIRRATEHCVNELDAAHVGYLDADSYPSDRLWLAHGLDIIERADGMLGFTYSPLQYVGFDTLPIFKAAYQAYEDVQRQLMKQVGWLANGQGFICSACTMTTYLAEARLTTEFDLRCALLSLSEGRRAYSNPGVLVTSGRRMTVNARNLYAWCFYDRTYYSKKDINSVSKLDLNAPHGTADLSSSMLPRFFERRALKMVARHILPLAIFDSTSLYFDRLRELLGVDLEADLFDTAKRFRHHRTCLFTDEFDEMIRLVEDHPATRVLSRRVADLIGERFSETASPAAAQAW